MWFRKTKPESVDANDLQRRLRRACADILFKASNDIEHLNKAIDRSSGSELSDLMDALICLQSIKQNARDGIYEVTSSYSKLEKDLLLMLSMQSAVSNHLPRQKDWIEPALTTLQLFVGSRETLGFEGPDQRPKRRHQ